MIRLLVSVRDVGEALAAARGGADFIDLKEPGQGALGGLPTATIGAVVAALRSSGCRLPVSATIGDVAMDEGDEIMRRVEAVAACGVDVVKVGITRAPEAADVLARLGACGRPVIPVFIADHGLDDAHLARALGLRFPGVMADTAEKTSGCLFDAVSVLALSRFVAQARAAGVMVGLAGALRLKHLPRLAGLAPDFAGFRSAVCEGDRSGRLEPALLAALVQALARVQVPSERASPSSSDRMRASSPL